MKNRRWINLAMVVFVAGLFFTVSCAKKTIVTEPTTIQSQEQMEKSAKAGSDSMAQNDQMMKEKEILEAKLAAAKKRFVNQDIHFEYDSSQLSPMAQTILKEKAAWLKDNFAAKVTIEGHCDERGTTEYNLALGERRASAVKAYLVDLGISASRLNTISYGEERPINPAKTEEAYRQNRRAHFSIN